MSESVFFSLYIYVQYIFIFYTSQSLIAYLAYTYNIIYIYVLYSARPSCASEIVFGRASSICIIIKYIIYIYIY